MKINIYKNRRLLWIVPLVGFVIALIYYFHPQTTPGSESVYYMIQGLFTTAGLWAGCFGIVTFLWKKYPWEHYPVKHLIYEVIAILLYTMLFGGIIIWMDSLLGLDQAKDSESDMYLSGILTIMITFFITGIHEAIYFYKQWKYHFSKSVRLEKDNLEAKYETLKNQVNPHFLFNSLNSLTYLVENNPNAVEYIQNLANILRYSLKSRDTELVSLDVELEILEKYIEIQNLRFKSNLKVSILKNENFNTYSIPPLTLQILLENCLKHNIVSKDKPLNVKIYQEDEYLVIENNLQKKQESPSTKQGLNNLIERYRYLSGNEIKVMETTDKFIVKTPLLSLVS